jgi:glutamate---cysteine ligase / carboxylate-amine ligase
MTGWTTISWPVGVITDAGMVYFDVRPALAAPTLELRVCDSCPSVDTIVLIAGLFRALVEREVEALRAGAPAVEIAPSLGRAAIWRAARSGLEGELVDISGPSRPAVEVVDDMVRSLRPQLEAVRDWAMITELTGQVFDRRDIGSSSAPGLTLPWPIHRRRRSAAL